MNKPRLIDANIINFRCSYDGDCIATDEKCEKCEYYVCNFEDIHNQPIAYDIDRVVEQLEELRTYEKDGQCPKHDMCSKEPYECTSCYTTTAIEIVKGGAE
jgi:hypothetical protein